ncbi:MAG: hypothetical protein AB7K86_09545 [Rhodospirillales bacterium]
MPSIVSTSLAVPSATKGPARWIVKVSPNVALEEFVWVRCPSGSTGPELGAVLTTDELARNAPVARFAVALPKKSLVWTVELPPHTNGAVKLVALDAPAPLSTRWSELGAGAPKLLVAAK